MGIEKIKDDGNYVAGTQGDVSRTLHSAVRRDTETFDAGFGGAYMGEAGEAGDVEDTDTESTADGPSAAPSRPNIEFSGGFSGSPDAIASSFIAAQGVARQSGVEVSVKLGYEAEPAPTDRFPSWHQM